MIFRKRKVRRVLIQSRRSLRCCIPLPLAPSVFCLDRHSPPLYLFLVSIASTLREMLPSIHFLSPAFILLFTLFALVACADLYKTLGVSRSASDSELKKAYKKLSRQYHPDKKGGDETKFVEVARGQQHYCFICSMY